MDGSLTLIYFRSGIHNSFFLILLLAQIPFMLRAGLLTTLTCGVGLAARWEFDTLVNLEQAANLYEYLR